MRYVKPVAAALALSVGALSFAAPAEAGQRYWRHGGYGHHHNGGGAAAAGIVGFAAGAILGGALAQPRYYGSRYYEPGYYEPRYYEPAPVYVRPAPVYSYAIEPWTPQWYDYCESKYRSFDPSSGYYLGYDGAYHFCR